MENPFKAALGAGRQQIGLWSSLCAPVASEIIADAGFDFIVHDTEHAPTELAGVLPLLHAVQGRPVHSIVRIAWNDQVLMKRALDLGAQTVLVPFVQSAAEAQAAVRASRYPPQGTRGVAGLTRASRHGTTPDYLIRANAEICLLVQVETAQALERIEEIAGVDGVDGVFIGPADLAASMGHLGESDHPQVQAAIRDALGRLRAVGKPSGILSLDEGATRDLMAMGVGFIAAGMDSAILARESAALAARLRGLR
jgi:4-hydroxy-2-oxoheptanedioate aldolase